MQNECPARKIGDAPFCWQSKPALRRIRDSLDKERTVASGIAVYVALTEIASDGQLETFTTTEAWIAMKAGVSVKTASDRLNDLIEVGLVQVSTPKLKAPSTVTLLSVRQQLPNDQQPIPNVRQQTKSQPLPTSEENKKKIRRRGEERPPANVKFSGPSNSIENWDGGLLAKDRDRLIGQIKDQRNLAKPDVDLIAGLKAQLKVIEDEFRRRGKAATANTVAPLPMTSEQRPAIVHKPDAKQMSDEERKVYGAELKKLREGLWKLEAAPTTAETSHTPS